ncbi:MAG: 50S ribosomal protein L16 [Nitrososphaerota archaeon]|nr:50S ribosomal protein L16 [Nitrososphaerota archaeon]
MKGRNYREVKGMPYVRREYIAGAPQPRVARFSQGGLVENYGYLLTLKSKDRAQIRHNALESARVAANKILEPLGEPNYHLRVVSYPHVVLRENKMVATAGADRLSEGMRRAFGKPVGLAARVENGSTILEVRVRDTDLPKGRAALEAARIKLPVRTIIGTASREEERKAAPKVKIEVKEKVSVAKPEPTVTEAPVAAPAPVTAPAPVAVTAPAPVAVTAPAPVEAAAPAELPSAAEQLTAETPAAAPIEAPKAKAKPRAVKKAAAAKPRARAKEKPKAEAKAQEASPEIKVEGKAAEDEKSATAPRSRAKPRGKPKAKARKPSDQK